MGKITDASYAQVRMQAITEVRNYLMAANRNLVAVHRLISPVNVPYCTADETKTLEKAINYIFIDGMSRDRQHHALSVYRTTQQRSVMLLRWITAVKTNKIAEDSKQLKQQTIDVNKRLRAERVRLMAVKVKEQTGEDITLDDDEDDDDSEAAAAAVAAASVVEAEQIQESDGLQERIKEATDKDEDGKPLEAMVKDAAETGEAETYCGKTTAAGEDGEDGDKPKPLDELAHQPSKQELFGDLDSVMAEYKKQQEQLVSGQEAARARQQSEFQERLRKRKSRKMKKQAAEVVTSS